MHESSCAFLFLNRYDWELHATKQTIMPIKRFEDLTPEELAKYDNVPFVNEMPIFRQVAFAADLVYFTEEEFAEYEASVKRCLTPESQEIELNKIREAKLYQKKYLLPNKE